MASKRKKKGTKGRSRSTPARSFPYFHWLAVLACVGGVAMSRPRVFAAHDKLGSKSDIYAIPGEDHLVLFSLGYRAATADLLFGRTLVASGMHFAERKVFVRLPEYLHGILALDPYYYDVYRYADTLLNLSTVIMPPENLGIARKIQERGLQLFPNDPQLWISSGQFIGFLAPNRMKNDDPRKLEWQAAGARILSHACDIWVDAELPDVCLNNASILSQAGEQEAAISALERLIAISDDERIVADAIAHLKRLTNERAANKTRETLALLDSLRMRDLPMTNRTSYQLVAPPSDPGACIGHRRMATDAKCATTFLERGDLMRRRSQTP